jgi:hypothetical protein
VCTLQRTSAFLSKHYQPMARNDEAGKSSQLPRPLFRVPANGVSRAREQTKQRFKSKRLAILRSTAQL